MARSKLQRFKEIATRDNVFEAGWQDDFELKGRWNTVFRNDNPTVLELGCGKGEYCVGLARIMTQKNFLGVDVKGARLWVGSTEAMKEELTNVAFLRAQVEHINKYFEQNEISDIWITFPDPRPKDRDIKRRLTSPRFLDMYKEIIKTDGNVFFKTDNTALFEYTLEVLNEREDITNLVYTFDLYNSPYMDEHFGIKTKFEKKFHALGEDIKYLRFKFQK